MKAFKGVVLHCSDSAFGSAVLIDKWHRERGFRDIGYHFVICNGQVESNVLFPTFDGVVEYGRGLSKSGAHTVGYNNTHIGICLIGRNTFTENQFKSLALLLKWLKERYGFTNEDIIGHCDVSSKTCPNFDIEWFKKEYLTDGE